MLPFSSFLQQSVSGHLIIYEFFSLTSLPGPKRKNFFGASSIKSSRSIHSSRENSISCVPSASFSGLLMAVYTSVLSSGKFVITSFTGFTTALTLCALLFRSSLMALSKSDIWFSASNFV